MLEANDQGHNAQVFSKKRFSLILPRVSSAFSKTKEKKGHDLGPFFTNQKNSAVLDRKQGIFEEL